MKRLIGLLIGAALATSASAKGAYTITTISGLLNQAETAARGVDNAGEVVGSDGATEAYPPVSIRRRPGVPGQCRRADLLAGVSRCYSLALGVATDGTIVGYAAPSSNQIEGFIRSPRGAFTGVTYPGAFFTRFYGVNPKGTEYVGNEFDASNMFHGLIDKGGALSIYDGPCPGSAPASTASTTGSTRSVATPAPPALTAGR